MSDVSSRPAATQAQRRVKYGLNVAVVAIIAAALCVLINVISAWSLSEGRARFDLTKTRRYSLSEQTRKTLRELQDPYRIVTIFSGDNELTEQARTLVDLYGQYSSKVTVDQLHPASDLGRTEAFYKDFKQRYAGQLESLDKTVHQGLDALAAFGREAKAQADKARSLVQDESVTDKDVKTLAGSLATKLTVDLQNLQAVDQQTKAEIGRPLPDYQAGLERLRGSLTDADAFITTIADAPKQPSAATRPAVVSVLTSVAEALGRIQPQLQAALKAINDAKPVPEYSSAVAQINGHDSVVILGPKQIRVLDITDMFHQRASSEGEAKPEVTFQGEEKITGALVSMTLAQPPLVVFVNPSSDPVLGPNGPFMFNQVAQRLRDMSFRVESWSPMPRGGPEGTMQPPQSPPQPAPGQKAVWILLPSFQPNYGEIAAADYVKKRMDAGDPVMLLIIALPGAPAVGGSAAAKMASDWGIEVQTDRVVLRQVPLASGRSRPELTHEVEIWPKDNPITRALTGMTGDFVQVSPLEIAPPKEGDKGPKAEFWPLVQITGSDIWAEQNLNPEGRPKRDPKTAKDSYTIMVAAQRGDKRIIVAGDAVWPADVITTNATPYLSSQYVGTAGVIGPVYYPANAELFVNSIYWLTGLDQLIAASPRTQDTRRIHHEFTIGQRLVLGAVLAGVIALATTVAGISVWQIRRKA